MLSSLRRLCPHEREFACATLPQRRGDEQHIEEQRSQRCKGGLCGSELRLAHVLRVAKGQQDIFTRSKPRPAASRGIRASRNSSGLALEEQGRFSYNTTTGRPRDGVTNPAYPLHSTSQQEIVMGKYVIGWVLGVPVVVLFVAYFFFH